MCNATFSSSIYLSNTTFLFDQTSPWMDRRRSFYNNDYASNYDFLNNQTLFCQRYDLFRNLSSTHLAIFTWTIVIIGIIFNSFVFSCSNVWFITTIDILYSLYCFNLFRSVKFSFEFILSSLSNRHDLFENFCTFLQNVRHLLPLLSSMFIHNITSHCYRTLYRHQISFLSIYLRKISFTSLRMRYVNLCHTNSIRFCFLY